MLTLHSANLAVSSVLAYIFTPKKYLRFLESSETRLLDVWMLLKTSWLLMLLKITCISEKATKPIK